MRSWSSGMTVASQASNPGSIPGGRIYILPIGYGPDFTVLRSRGVLMNIPRTLRELQEEIPEGSINGSGRLVVGSIKFLGGLRTKLLAKLAEKIGTAEVGMG